MILVDYSQTFRKSLAMQLHLSSQSGGEAVLNTNEIRRMILTSILSYLKKYRKQYGELVIACDDRKYWRREFFPQYKFHRKEQREETKIDWVAAFKCLDEVREELIKYFPYRVIQVEGAEADDVIGTICHKFGTYLGNDDPILIISADMDFGQLQIYSNIYQYDPIQKKNLSVPNPVQYLKEQIIRGQKKDSIPNILMPDNTFVDNIKQKSMFTAKIINWLDQNPEQFCDAESINNYRRNEKLIDLSLIPDYIQEKVITNFEQQKNKGRGKLFDYFIKYKLKSLMTNIQEF